MMKRNGVVILSILSLFKNTLCDNNLSDLQTYLLANYHQFGQQTSQAQKLYGQLIQKKVSPYVFKGYVPFLLSNHQFTEIVRLAPQLDSLFENDIEIQQNIAQAYANSGNKAGALNRMAKLQKKFPENQEIAFELVKLHLENQQFDHAILVIDQLLNSSPRKPNNFIFYFLKSQIALQKGNKPEALKHIRLCLELYPKFDKAWLMYATLKEQAGRLEEAIKGYTNFLDTTSDKRDRQLEKHVLELVLKRQISIQNKPDLGISQDNLKNILTLLDSHNYIGAVNTFEKCLSSSCQDHKKQLLVIQSLVDNKKITQAAHAVSLLLEKEPNEKLWYDVLHLLCVHDLPYNKGIALIEGIIKKNSTCLQAYLYGADLLLRDHQEKKAVGYLEHALELTQSKYLKTVLWYQIAAIHYQNKQLQNFKNALTNGLNQQVTYAPLYNLQSYYYMRCEHDFEKAHACIAKALKLEPSNIYFQDTLAYVYYKEKKYDNAYQVWQKLAETEGGKDYTIQKHLAKINHQLGNTQQAIAILKKAVPLTQTPKQKKEISSLIKRWSTYSA